MKLIFLGPPGAGKGTMAERIVELKGIPQISTGEILRAAMREKTEIGLRAQSYIEAGELVPDELILQIIRERLQRPDCGKGYLFDGFPRTLPQAIALDGFAKMDVVLNLAVSFDEIIQRLSGRRSCVSCGATTHVNSAPDGKCLKCGASLVRRKDDDPETVKNRLEVYERQTKPLIDYYDKQGLLRTVDGSGSIEKVFKLVEDALRGL